MKPTAPAPPPTFETQEQLWELLAEGFESGEGTEMTPEEWRRLREELEVPAYATKLAS